MIEDLLASEQGKFSENGGEAIRFMDIFASAARSKMKTDKSSLWKRPA